MIFEANKRSISINCKVIKGKKDMNKDWFVQDSHKLPKFCINNIKTCKNVLADQPLIFVAKTEKMYV